MAVTKILGGQQQNLIDDTKSSLDSSYSSNKINDDFLSKSGGTLTGALNLSGDPTTNSMAANKGYVDEQVANIENEAFNFKGYISINAPMDDLKEGYLWYKYISTNPESDPFPWQVYTYTSGTWSNDTTDYTGNILDLWVNLDVIDPADDTILLTDFVNIKTAQTVGGIKTFTSVPIVTNTPINSTDVVNKNYVDNLPRTTIIETTNTNLTLSIGDNTTVPKSDFPTGQIFYANRTLIDDGQGSVGVYLGDIDAANINVKTLTTSIDPSHQPQPLGSVEDYVDLPVTTSDANTLWGITPQLQDYCYVVNDSTHNNNMYRYSVIAIDGSGNITWGSAIGPLSNGDYQAQTTSAMSGQVLIAGANPGTWGISKTIDTAITSGSNNLITSGGISSSLSITIDQVATGRTYFGQPTYTKGFIFTTSSTDQSTLSIDIGVKITDITDIKGSVIKDSAQLIPIQIGRYTNENVLTTNIDVINAIVDNSGATSVIQIYSDGYVSCPGKIWIEYILT